jgi:hypothetical protein
MWSHTNIYPKEQLYQYIFEKYKYAFFNIYKYNINIQKRQKWLFCECNPNTNCNSRTMSEAFYKMKQNEKTTNASLFIEWWR